MPVEAGRLIHRVSVVEPGLVQNVGGVAVPGEPVAVQTRIAAEVTTATASRLERVFASHVQAQATHIVKVHAGRTWSIKNKAWLVWHDGIDGDRRLEILGVADPDGRRVELLIAATERRA